jgi:hypothetical protein
VDRVHHPARPAQCGDHHIGPVLLHQVQLGIEAAIGRMRHHVRGEGRARIVGVGRGQPFFQHIDGACVGEGEGGHQSGGPRGGHQLRARHQEHGCNDGGKAHAGFQAGGDLGL